MLERFEILEKLVRDNVFEHSKCAIASIEHSADVHGEPDALPGAHHGEAPAAGL